MDERIERNRARLLTKLPPDCRTDAANKHVEALLEFPIEEVKRQLLGRKPYDIMYDSFLAGWDAAMGLQMPELLDEHLELHGRIMDAETDKMRANGEIEE